MIEEVLNNSAEAVEGVLSSSQVVLYEAVGELSKTLRWLEAVGVVVLLWLVFQTINLIINRKKRKAIYSIKEDVKRIEKKLDKVLRKV